MSELQTLKLSEIAHIEMGQSPDSNYVTDNLALGIPFLQGNAEFGEIHPTPKYSCSQPQKLCKAHDILISVRAPVGEVNIADQEYCIGRGLAAIRFHSMPVKLAAKIIEFTEASLRKVAQGTTFEAISKYDLLNLEIEVHPENEKSFLNEIVDSIDTNIRQTEAIIAKLQQVKKGLLHDLLTRGIDDSGQLRPPQHLAPELYKETSQGHFPIDWEEIPLGQMAEIVSGVTVGGNGKGSLVSDVPYLRVANVQDGYLDLSEIKTIKVSQQERDRYLLQYGDVLMNEGGDFDKLGRGTVWENQIPICIHQNHVFRVRTDANKLRPFYLAYWSASTFGKRYFINSSKQTTNLASINSKQLHAYPIMVPPEHEQLAIEGRVASINQKIEIETAKKDKLKKQKSGLMNDLLTGKVRVTSLL
ncbi:restriction endonuclease subunit S [Endozoicomonas acroporae]|uniref:restriction endonuclease subunit S n=1 Tax=Endozoicomonas acroporae TaxID=1701104 RepID=UPI0013D36A3D|nr:restriction endonuclease subunit S [Endozoicomonas acroporae]